MDIQKLEQIVLTDAKAEAQELIQQTKLETENWLLEQSNLAEEEHLEELSRIKSDHQSKLSILKASLAADFHKNVGKTKKDKMVVLKKELMKTMLEKIKNSPTWILDKTFSTVPVKSGKFIISEDMISLLPQEKVELYLKKYPSFSWGGYDKTIETGLSYECNTVRYLFLLEEMVDEFIETNSDQIVNLLFP